MAKRILLVVALLFLASVGYAGYKLYPFYRLYTLKDKPATTLNTSASKAIFLATGASVSDVAKMLGKQGLLKSQRDFVVFARAKNYKKHRIVPGKYKIKGSMTYNQLVNHLRAGRGRLSVKVSFHAVKHLDQLAEIVSNQIEPTASQLKKAFHDPATHSRYHLTKETFKTMFLSDTYRLNWACSPTCFLDRMSKAYHAFWKRHGHKARKLGLSRFQVAILASIVQAEQSKRPDEWPKIAGLYLNRLKRKMKLEADPTVKYALGQPGLRRILFKHLKVDSPYNTYLHHGLPPGPIRWPLKQAMLAVLNYERHDYIYMCAKPTFSGTHNFAKTMREHKRNARLYHRWLTKQGIR